MNPPTPATRTAYLPSKGYDNMRATQHKFVKATEHSFENKLDGGWEDVWLFWYACQETGVERVWGFESRDVTAIPTSP